MFNYRGQGYTQSENGRNITLLKIYVVKFLMLGTDVKMSTKCL